MYFDKLITLHILVYKQKYENNNMNIYIYI